MNWHTWNGIEHWGNIGVYIIREMFYVQILGTRLDSVTEDAYSWFYWGYLASGNLFGS